MPFQMAQTWENEKKKFAQSSLFRYSLWANCEKTKRLTDILFWLRGRSTCSLVPILHLPNFIASALSNGTNFKK